MSFAARVAAATCLICALNAHAAGAQEPAQPSPTQAVNSSTHWLVDPQTGCRAPNPDFADGDDIAWSGACVGGVVTGQGTLTFLNKGQPQVTISGTFRNGDLETGHASLAWPNGSRYDGEQIGGKFNGKGVFVSAQQDRLDGEWKDGALSGHAIVAWANGNRYEGGWLNGKAQGQGVETWANGDRYDGEWNNDQPNGMGKLVRADRTTYAGKFVDGHPEDQMAPKQPASAAVASTMIAPAVAPGAAVLPVPAVTEKLVSVSRGNLVDVEGKKLVAVDGSSIALSESEGGFTRAITKPDGTSATLAFTFVNDRMGTVADAGDPARITGLFKMTDAEIAVDYSDGHSEVLRPGSSGVTLSLHTSDGQSTCVAWYPQGHSFSDGERRIALAEYANKLGISLKGADAKAVKHVSACSQPAPAIANSATQHMRNVPHPLGRPIQASFELPATPTAQPIIVRESRVHPIDPPKPVYISSAGGQSSTAPPVQPAPPPSAPVIQPAVAIASAIAPAVAREPVVTPPITSVAPEPSVLQSSATASYQPDTSDPGASSCLVVASDGTHWGFRNSCRYSVQFVYCLKGETEQLASCKDGAISGSAAPDSFSALVADGSMKETNIDHQFRWVACGGGAGEVIPKLDGIDPPVGRCLRARTASR
jgi:hypothetical protein